jgi:hypothetical protein
MYSKLMMTIINLSMNTNYHCYKLQLDQKDITYYFTDLYEYNLLFFKKDSNSQRAGL